MLKIVRIACVCVVESVLGFELRDVVGINRDRLEYDVIVWLWEYRLKKRVSGGDAGNEHKVVVFVEPVIISIWRKVMMNKDYSVVSRPKSRQPHRVNRTFGV